MFELQQVVPWGRSFGEYRRMFALSDGDLTTPILGCADGPASFNVEATRLGGRVISCDPLYRWTAQQIRHRIAETSQIVLEQTRQHAHEFVWDTIASVEELASLRAGAMDAFLDDYDTCSSHGRYVAAELPRLPFGDRSFRLAVCSHFLFLYSDQLSERFHQDAIVELCRVASEVRIFPLLGLGGRPSPHLTSVAETLEGQGYRVTIEGVPYEFQRGGNEMMRIRGYEGPGQVRGG